LKKRKHINTSGVRILTVIISLALCLGFTVSIKANDGGQAVGAVGYAMERAGERNVSVYVNGQRYGGRAFLSGSVTYVGIREFSMHMAVSSVSWNSERKTATVKSDSLSLSARNANLYITANGRYLWAGSGVIIRNGTMYVPLRTLAKAFGCSVSWNAADFSASVTGGGAIVSGDGFYNSESLYWLSRIIHAEASGESLLGKVAVGTVVLNRVASPEFPNSIHGVIFDKKNGVQFTPVANGAINCTPSEESVIAAKLCLDGASISDKALFFINEALAQSSWVSDNRPFLIAVGNHKFYA